MDQDEDRVVMALSGICKDFVKKKEGTIRQACRLFRDFLTAPVMTNDEMLDSQRARRNFGIALSVTEISSVPGEIESTISNSE